MRGKYATLECDAPWMKKEGSERELHDADVGSRIESRSNLDEIRQLLWFDSQRQGYGMLLLTFSYGCAST